ncbi:MAG: hypothetical protein QM478_07970 [Flavobacteriaceae bacterium]
MTSLFVKKTYLLILPFFITFSFNTVAQDSELISKAQTALNQMFEKNSKLKPEFDKAYGHAIFPEIKKVGIAIGGAGGRGVVYLGDNITGGTKMSQASIGFQLGAQKYSELILFKNKKAYDYFIGGKLKFNADLNAVALDADAGGLDSPYQTGVKIYTMAQGGVMFSASVAGQKFSFEGKTSK